MRLLLEGIHLNRYLYEKVLPMTKQKKMDFDVETYLAQAGKGRTIVQMRKAQVFFSQGATADSVYYLQKGRVKISVVSATGKEATVRLVSRGDFFGEKAMEAKPSLRITRATALTDCTALRIGREEFIRIIREEKALSSLFSAFLLACSTKPKAHVVNQDFNKFERRLARLLLLFAENTRPGDEDVQIPQISQATLANMIGSTQPRVSAFMNRFRELGFIEFASHILVHKSLLDVFLRD
jgi:CRP-like cAMP-binding protein